MGAWNRISKGERERRNAHIGNLRQLVQEFAGDNVSLEGANVYQSVFVLLSQVGVLEPLALLVVRKLHSRQHLPHKTQRPSLPQQRSSR